MTNEEINCRQNVYRYFWPELNGKCKPGWVLHHKNPKWKTEDPERYHQWRITDLIPMTFSEHIKWHAENDSDWIKKVSQLGKNNPMFGVHRYGENNPMFGVHHSEESRQKMSEAHLGKHPSEDTRQKLSEASSGENNGMFGKHHSDETKQKMSEAKSGEKCYAFGLHWYNNGVINILAKICPQGFKKGRVLNK